MPDTHYRLTAIMFTDIVGYSRMMGEDEPRTIALLERYRAILEPIITAHDGRVLEFIGDAVLASFESGLEAVQAAIEIQRALTGFNRENAGTGDGQPVLRSRIGIHLGDVVVKNNHIFGDDVNVAARLEPLAEPGGICISQAVYEQIRDKPGINVVPLGPQVLKNIKERIIAYQVVPAGADLGLRLRYRLRYGRTLIKARPWLSTVFAFALLAVLGTFLAPRFWLPEEARANYLAVAPFKDLSPGSQDDYFSEGIWEAVTAQLAGIRGLYLVPLEKDIGAPWLLEGHVQKRADRVRISYRLLQRADKVQIAGGVIDGHLREIFTLQDRVAEEIATRLAARLGLGDARPATLNFTGDINAYDYYMQARAYLRRPKNLENIEHAIRLFQTALENDRDFARAHAGLCEAYWWKYDDTRKTVWVERAEGACREAGRLDKNLFEVHLALGTIYRGTGRWQEAVSAYNRAIELHPQGDDAYRRLARVYLESGEPKKAEEAYRRAIRLRPGHWAGYHWFGFFLVNQGRYGEAIENYNKVIQLTPDNVYGYTNLGGAYFFQGDFQKAAEALRRSIELTPTSAGYSNTGTMLYYAGDYQEAVRMFEQAVALAPDDHRLWVNLAGAYRHLPGNAKKAEEAYGRAIALAEERLRINRKDAESYKFLAIGYAQLQRKKEAREMIQRALALVPGDVDILFAGALVWERLGEREKALEALKQAVAAGYSRKLIVADPDLSELREDPDFQALTAE